jgi:hypothetical protein
MQPEIIPAGGVSLESLGVHTAVALYDKHIPPIRWVVKDFLGEGVTLLSARPKAGKSLLALQIAIAVTKGQPLLDAYETVQSVVLYVTVDDPRERRFQANLHQLGGRVEGLYYVQELAELDNGGLEKLDEMLTKMAQTEPCRLVILDTLTALRKEQRGKCLVKADYDFMIAIARLGRKHGCSVLVISHSRKDAKSPDKVDGIDLHLGSSGLTAAVDAVMIMIGAEGTRKVLQAKGRDFSPFELNLELQVTDRSGWRVAEAPAAPAKKTAELSSSRIEILDAVRAIGPGGPDAIHKKVGGNINTVRSLLKRMLSDGQIQRNSDGLYVSTPPQCCNGATDAPPAPTATDALGAMGATESADVLQHCGIAPLQAPTHVALIEETDVAATPAADATVAEPTAEELEEAAASMDMGWPEKVILLIQQTQDLEAIAAAVGVPVSHVENVMWMDPRVNSRTQNGRRFYFIEEVE